MIKSLKLKNFRNFGNLLIDFKEEKNFIIGKNGKGKTNTLEALSLLTNNSIIGIEFEKLVKKDENFFFIEYTDNNGNKIGISFDKENKKKNYIINGKKTTKKNLAQNTPKSVIFSPIIMNIMYLSPSLRRNFLDNILINSFSEYEQLLKHYKKILKSRNLLLKNIRENKSKKEELVFWDNEFIKISKKIYDFRFMIIKFLQKHIPKSSEYFRGKINDVTLIYETKVEKNNIEESIKSYLDKNIERDIITGKTYIGPHIDDFDILVDNIKLTDFASRGETKSIVLWMKLLETAFIEKYTNKKPIILIDDLLSELDEIHKNILIDKIKYYQTFITGIKLEQGEKNIIKL